MKTSIHLSIPMSKVLSYQIRTPEQRRRYNENFLSWLESRLFDARTGVNQTSNVDLNSLPADFRRQLYKLFAYGGRLNVHLKRRRKIVERFVRGSHPLDRLARCAE